MWGTNQNPNRYSNKPSNVAFLDPLILGTPINPIKNENQNPMNSLDYGTSWGTQNRAMDIPNAPSNTNFVKFFQDIDNVQESNINVDDSTLPYLDIDNENLGNLFESQLIQGGIDQEYSNVPMNNPQDHNLAYLNKMEPKKEEKPINWMINSFLPTPAINTVEENLGSSKLSTSVSFIGTSINFKNNLERYLSAKKKFRDKYFPPQLSSIVGFSEKTMSGIDKLQWAEPRDIFRSNNYRVYENTIDPNEIVQGSLGDCYFLSAVAAISEYPDRIKRIFLTRTPNKCGIYCVALCINGIWEEVIMDELFPVRQNLHPAFSYSKVNDLWVMLLEKAYAKVHGGYLNIEGGTSEEALKDLTSAPCKTFILEKETIDANWINLLLAYNQRYIMSSSSKDLIGNGMDDVDKTTGLTGSHAYSILGVYEIERAGDSYRVAITSNPSNIRLIKLRNPWGKGEWKGNWGRNDPRWTESLANALNVYNQINDGVLMMDFNDYTTYFHDYNICYYLDKNIYSSQRYNTSRKEPTILSFSVSAPGEYYLGVTQINKRFFPKKHNYEYSTIALMIGRYSKRTGFSFVGMKCSHSKEDWIKASLQKGNYIAYINTPWKSNVNQIVFSSYGPSELEFQFQGNAPPHDFIKRCLLDNIAISKDEKFTEFAPDSEPGLGYGFKHCNDGFGWFHFQNPSKGTTMTVTIDIKAFENIQFSK